MPYIANQYNHSTPLQSSTNLTNAEVLVNDAKYFTLFDNTLDGSYRPVSGDVGLWGNSVAGSDGVLPEPFVVTVYEAMSVRALNVAGSIYCYPVDFTIALYNVSNLLYTHTVTGNTSPSVICKLPEVYGVTHYELSVTKVSSAGVARLYNTYQSWYYTGSDSIRISAIESRSLSVKAVSNDMLAVVCDNGTSDVRNTLVVSDTIKPRSAAATRISNTIAKTGDRIVVSQSYKSHILNTIDRTYDSIVATLSPSVSHVLNTARAYDSLLCDCDCSMSLDSALVNVHSRMKDPTRRIYGKVYITYTDPLLDASVDLLSSSGEAYNSELEQLTDGVDVIDGKFFTLYDNDLSGSYLVSSDGSQVGWTSSVLSDSDGYFAEPPSVTLHFAARPIVRFSVAFDGVHNNIAKDFAVAFKKADGTVTTVTYTDNENEVVAIPITQALPDIVEVTITVSRTAMAHAPATIVDTPTFSRVLYTGYEDDSNLISIDLLEELTYNDEIEALGGVSANEVTIVLDNVDKQFNLNNPNSPIANQLRRNRKVEPYLGTEVIPGQIEWYSLGTYWSYSWDVPYDSLTASVTAFDTIGLLGLTPFTNHTVQIDKSIGELIDYVLNDAKHVLHFLTWEVDAALYNAKVPYAWFAPSNHAAALRKISEAYPMHIYCRRDGSIAAAPQHLQVEHYIDSWSDDTNVISKKYSSLYTVLPNVINVTVVNPTVKLATTLVTDTLTFDVADMPTRTLNFREPCVAGFVATVECDDTVQYTYDVRSWGVVFNFTGTGNVTSIKCTGASLDTSNTTTITRRDEASIIANGVVTRDVSADFIQTSAVATYVINRLFELSNYDKYDVEVTYRGDIALSINDPVLLLDGIAPSNKYLIKRHQLTWNGYLTGVADLNT